MYCNKCGTEIQGNYKYCPVCGSEIYKSGKNAVPKKIYIIALLIVLLFTGILFTLQNNGINQENENIVKGSVIYADHSSAEAAAYEYITSILLVDNPTDYANFTNATVINWNGLFSKLNKTNNNVNPHDIFLKFFSDNNIFENMPDGYDYFMTKTISVTDYDYTEIHKTINLFSKLFRPLSLSPVTYIPFSEIRTLNSVVISVEFYDTNDNLIATEQFDITVVAESDEYYSPRDYSVLYDNFFMEKFITSLYPEETSTAFHK